MKKITIISIIIIGIIIYSCKKEEDIINNNTVTNKIAKIETLYQNGNIKNESKHLKNGKEETIADDSEIDSVRNIVESEINEFIERNPETKGDGYVGVIKVETCMGYDEFDIRIDTEDDDAESWISGSIGSCSIDGNKNITLRFCLVPKMYFERLSNKIGSYAVLQVSPKIDYTDKTITRYIDAEDDNNQSYFVYNGVVYNPNQLAYQLVAPTYLTNVGNIYMQFIYYEESETGAMDLPTINAQLNYGVFGTLKNKPHGEIYTDDEDDSNDNYFIDDNGTNHYPNPTYTFPYSFSTPIMTLNNNTLFYTSLYQ
jgi:hypothetical protein